MQARTESSASNSAEVGFQRTRQLHERALETAIVDGLQSFLLELGKGFASIGR